MFKPVLALIPDDVLEWSGTAAELADKLNELLPVVGLPEQAEKDSPVNERLVRHYVHMGVLTPPARQGREALFGARQVFEFVIARFLLGDGWPLAKIAELVKTYDLPPSRVDPGTPDTPTAAQLALERIRSASPKSPEPRQRAIPRGIARQAHESLADAAQMSMRRLDVGATLRSLGNPSGAPERTEVVQIGLTPWCSVQVDTAVLRRLGPEVPDALGHALAHALHQERLKKGDRT